MALGILNSHDIKKIRLAFRILFIPGPRYFEENIGKNGWRPVLKGSSGGASFTIRSLTCCSLCTSMTLKMAGPKEEFSSKAGSQLVKLLTLIALNLQDVG